MLVSKKINIPILTYHSIDESGSVISTEPHIFHEQMRYLSENDYTAVSLNQFINSVQTDSVDSKTVVLTFDDGFNNFYTEAFPVIEECGFNATVFLVTDFCGKYNDWDGNPADLPRSKLLSWQKIKELDKYGIEFGVHTQTHPDLTRLSQSAVEAEITESKSTIENEIGKKVQTFAYPYGKFNRSVRKVAEENFKAACSTNLGKVTQGSDLFSLERVDTYYLSNPKIFSSLSTKSFDQYLKFRQVMRSFKSLINQNQKT